jgi:hypothetical protein
MGAGSPTPGRRAGARGRRGVVEDAAVGIRLAWQAPEGVPLGLDLEAVHGRPDDGDVGTPIGLRNPELKDRLSRGRSAGQHLGSQRLPDLGLGHHGPTRRRLSPHVRAGSRRPACTDGSALEGEAKGTIRSITNIRSILWKGCDSYVLGAAASGDVAGRPFKGKFDGGSETSWASLVGRSGRSPG